MARRYSRHTAPLVMSPSAQQVWLPADYTGVLFGARSQQRTTTEQIPPQYPYREIIEKCESWPIARMQRSTRDFNQRRGQRVFRPPAPCVIHSCPGLGREILATESMGKREYPT